MAQNMTYVGECSVVLGRVFFYVSVGSGGLTV